MTNKNDNSKKWKSQINKLVGFIDFTDLKLKM